MSAPFKVIVADCPWLFSDKLPDTKGAAWHYPCMSTYDICRLADTTSGKLMIMDQPIAEDATLFLWRVAAMQQSALDVVKAWRFTVKSELIWLKKTVNGDRWFGMGRTLRAEHEACLVATRGRPQPLNHSVHSTFISDFTGLSATVGRHSEKPDAFYKIVEQLYDGPRLELFARQRREGWTSIGDQLEPQTAQDVADDWKMRGL